MKLADVIDYIKLEHTVFDIPFIFSGYVIAAGHSVYPIKILLIFIAAVSARSSAMSLNRILGAKYDVANPRKRTWALASGRMSMKQAIYLTSLFVTIFEVSSFLLNTFVLVLSPVVIFLFLSDPLLKRYTVWRHLYMASAIGIGVIAGYLAVIPSFPSAPVIYLIFIATSFWIAGFDMIYVIPDIDFDRVKGLKTVMAKYGIRKGLIISDIFHSVALLAFWLLTFYMPSFWYLLAVISITFLIVYQHIIINPDDPKLIRNSFFRPNSFIGFIFLLSLILNLAVPLGL
ncbi:MAG: UbiA-like polyprenyltransferase [Thermoplasmatales archaeon]